MEIRPDALIPLVGAIVNLGVAIFVLLQSPRSTVSRVFFLLGISFATWNFGTYWMFRTELRADRYDEALFWARFIQFGVIWIPLTLCHVSFLIAGIRVNWRWWATAYALHFLLFLSNFTNFVVKGVRQLDYAWYTQGNPGFAILFVVFGLMWVSVIVLIRHRSNQPFLARRRLTPLIVAQTAIAVFGSNDALPILGIDHYPLTNLSVYPFGSMAVILYGLIVGYSVLQHQLLNVHVVMGRYSAHIVRMFFLFLIGFCLLLVVAVLTHHFDTVSFLASLGVLVISAVIATTIFPRLFGGAPSEIEGRMVGDQFEYQDQVRSFLNSLLEYTEMARLQEDLHFLFVRTFRLESYQLILREEVTQSFFLLQAHPEEASRPLPEFRLESPLFEYFAEGKREYLSLSSQHLRFAASALERRARSQLTHVHGEFCFPLVQQEEPLGLLVTGRKISRDPYTSTDVRLLSALAREVSVAVNQIRLKNQIHQAQELELLGRMSRGMAHDLNNLLTPVSTFLQLSEETGTVEKELLPVAMRNLESMRAYIREALFFSEHLRPDIQPARLDRLVRQAIEVAANSRPKEVQLVAQIPEHVPAEVDGVLVQRLIANLITNAIDASSPGGEIVVSVASLASIDKNREWLRVRITDKGEGIARENLNRIFTPYFTTKDRGDQERGFGLGLAICRRIASLHGGNLSIESQLKKGTTVQLDLPSRQAVEPPMAIPTAA